MAGATPQPPMQRTHKRETPLTQEELAQAREAEKARKKWDPSYITAAEAREMPAEVAARPDVAARVQYSQPDWPENRMSATEALGPLPTGAGESYIQKEQRPAEELFSPEPRGGMADAKHER